MDEFGNKFYFLGWGINPVNRQLLVKDLAEQPAENVPENLVIPAQSYEITDS